MEKKSSILVVDDKVGPREALRMILKNKYEVVTAEDGDSALEYIGKKEFYVAIIDIKMAGMDGLQLLKRIKEKKPDIEVILMTAYASVDTAKKALRYGALDYLIKPFDHRDVTEIVGKGVAKRMEQLKTRLEIERLYMATSELSKKVDDARRNIENHYASTVKALLATIDAKDQYTRGHSERVARFSAFLAEKTGFQHDKILSLEQAALIHDIGKIGVEGYILKKQGSLDTMEFDEIKKHPQIGAKIITSVDFLQEMKPIILCHHERFDGSGFPDGIRGSAIPLSARLVAVADAVDAMLCDRPYRPALALEHVKEELTLKAGKQFDPDVVSVVLSSGLLECYSGIFDYQNI